LQDLQPSRVYRQVICHPGCGRIDPTGPNRVFINAVEFDRRYALSCFVETKRWMTMSEAGETKRERPQWQTPVLIEEVIADLTQNQANRPGDDGLDQFGGVYYLATGPS